jgi:integrase
VARSTPRRPGQDRVAGRPRWGPWVFSREPSHQQRLTTSGLGHWFSALCHDADQPQVTLHRLRHSVATALVSRGDILAAQHRLGHADPHTTLRIYSHAQPLADLDAADLLDQLYDTSNLDQAKHDASEAVAFTKGG